MVTVICALAFAFPKLAVTLVVPIFIPEASPDFSDALLTVIIFGFSLPQVTTFVRSREVLFEYIPVATRNKDVPFAMFCRCNVISIFNKSAFEIGASAIVTRVVAVMPAKPALIVAEPVFEPVMI